MRRCGPIDGVQGFAFIISPYIKRRFVDHTTYETVSILKLIESRRGSFKAAQLQDSVTLCN